MRANRRVGKEVCWQRERRTASDHLANLARRDGDHHLSEVLRLPKSPHGLGSLVQGIRPIDHALQTALPKHLAHAVQVRVRLQGDEAVPLVVEDEVVLLPSSSGGMLPSASSRTDTYSAKPPNPASERSLETRSPTSSARGSVQARFLRRFCLVKPALERHVERLRH